MVFSEQSDKSPEPAASTRAPLEQGAQLDLAFLLDSTGSMGSYIAEATRSIETIVSTIVQSERADVQFALVAYRDHPPQDSTFITKTFPFTRSTWEMKKNLQSLSATGGGDGPEAVTTALYDALRLPWRPNATKMAVIIADAPPHGLGESGDGFPNGEPNGHDPICIAREMASHGITLYSVACEPALSQTKFGVDFFRAIAKITSGIILPLTSASLLPDVIIGGAREQMDLDRIAEEAYKIAEENRKKGMAEEEVTAKVYSELKSRKVQSKQLKVESLYETSAAAESNLAMLEGADSLRAAVSSGKMKNVESRLKSHAYGGSSPGGYGGYSDSGPATLSFSEPKRSKSNKGSSFLSSIFPSRRKSSAAPDSYDSYSSPPIMMPASVSMASSSESSPYVQKVEFCESEDISVEQVSRLVSKSKFAKK